MYRMEVNYGLLTVGVFAGAVFFTLFGLTVGTVSRSINHYFVIGVPVGIVLMAPAFLVFVEVNSFLAEMLPAVLLLRVLYSALGLEVPYWAGYAALGLILWCIPAYLLASRAFTKYMDRGGD